MFSVYHMVISSSADVNDLTSHPIYSWTQNFLIFLVHKQGFFFCHTDCEFRETYTVMYLCYTLEWKQGMHLVIINCFPTPSITNLTTSNWVIIISSTNNINCLRSNLVNITKDQLIASTGLGIFHYTKVHISALKYLFTRYNKKKTWSLLNHKSWLSTLDKRNKTFWNLK